MKPTEEQLIKLVSALIEEAPSKDFKGLTSKIRRAIEIGHPSLDGQKFDVPKANIIYQVITSVKMASNRPSGYLAAIRHPLDQKPLPNPGEYSRVIDVSQESQNVTESELLALGVRRFPTKLTRPGLIAAKCPKCKQPTLLLATHYERIQRERNEEFDVLRLKFIYDLKPNSLYVGLGSFEGYVAFIFKRTNVAVLDCPKIGNAIYGMAANKWASLSQLSKKELLAEHSHEIKRIIHTGAWKWRVEFLVSSKWH